MWNVFVERIVKGVVVVSAAAAAAGGGGVVVDSWIQERMTDIVVAVDTVGIDEQS